MNTKMIFTCVFLIFLSGCSYMGEDKYSQAYIQSHVIKNKTTQAEVQALYGIPDWKSSTVGWKEWRYDKGADFSSLSNAIQEYIPKASGYLTMANKAQSNANKFQKAANKMIGNSSQSGTQLIVRFNERDVVTDWDLF